MSVLPWEETLREITGVVGVRGALIVSAEDGLVVAESAMEGLETASVAAFAASLIARAERTAAAMQLSAPTRVHVTAEAGMLFAVAGAEPLWLVAVTDPSAELGRLRLLLGDLAAALT